MHPFRAALEARDLDAAEALLSGDVVFRSPIVFREYEGRDAVDRLAFGINHNRSAARVIAVKAQTSIDVDLRAPERPDRHRRLRAEESGSRSAAVDRNHLVDDRVPRSIGAKAD